MKKTIYNKFDKAAINALPLVEYPYKINVILNEYEAERAVDYLLTCDILGVDTETKPAFRRGQNHKVALLQVATRDQCFLFRLNHLGMPQSVIRLLSNRMVPMVDCRGTTTSCRSTAVPSSRPDGLSTFRT